MKKIFYTFTFIIIFIILPPVLFASDFVAKDNSRAGLTKYERIGYNEKVLVKLQKK